MTANPWSLWWSSRRRNWRVTCTVLPSSRNDRAALAFVSTSLSWMFGRSLISFCSDCFCFFRLSFSFSFCS